MSTRRQPLTDIGLPREVEHYFEKALAFANNLRVKYGIAPRTLPKSSSSGWQESNSETAVSASSDSSSEAVHYPDSFESLMTTFPHCVPTETRLRARELLRKLAEQQWREQLNSNKSGLSTSMSFETPTNCSMTLQESSIVGVEPCDVAEEERNQKTWLSLNSSSHESRLAAAGEEIQDKHYLHSGESAGLDSAKLSEESVYDAYFYSTQSCTTSS